MSYHCSPPQLPRNFEGAAAEPSSEGVIIVNRMKLANSIHNEFSILMIFLTTQRASLYYTIPKGGGM